MLRKSVAPKPSWMVAAALDMFAGSSGEAERRCIIEAKRKRSG